MARPLKPLVKGGGYYPSNRWTPLVYRGGYTTANGGGEQPSPVEKTASGAIVHITDALAKPAQSLSVKLEPIQDLHGYDSPWPEGGGKNKIDGQDITVIASTDNQYAVTDSTVTLAAGTYTLSFTVGANVTATRSRPMYLVGGTATYAETDYKTQGRQSWTFTLSAETILQFKWWGHTLSANCTISDFMLESGSTATAWSPYSNICPISGRTSATVTRTGKNLLPNISGRREVNSVFIGQSDGSTYPTHLKAGVTYAISFTTNIGSGFSYMRENEGSNIYFGIPGGTYTPEKDMNVQLWVYANGLTTVSDFQLEVGNATSYEPYAGDTYSITFPASAGTVYGGTLDVTTGKLTVDRAMVDLGTLSWIASSTPNCFYTNEMMPYAVGSDVKMVCSAYKFDGARGSAPYYGENGTIRCYIRRLDTDAKEIYVHDDRYTSASDFKTAVSGVQFVYELATPIEISLTPTQIDMLLGTNNLWADAGDSTLTYYADGNASEIEALNILLGNRYYNNHTADEPTDREALDIVLGGKK